MLRHNLLLCFKIKNINNFCGEVPSYWLYFIDMYKLHILNYLNLYSYVDALLMVLDMVFISYTLKLQTFFPQTENFRTFCICSPCCVCSRSPRHPEQNLVNVSGVLPTVHFRDKKLVEEVEVIRSSYTTNRSIEFKNQNRRLRRRN